MSGVMPARHKNAALRIDHLTVTYHRRGRAPVPAVVDVNLAVEAGTTVAIIGESGSGKSSLARAICGLTPISSGCITVAETDMTKVPYHRRARSLGAAGVGIVFQNPLVALDPRWPVWRSVDEASPKFRLWKSQNEGRRRAVDLLDRVGLPASIADRRPRNLSGGQLQRVTIARALAARPQVLLYDEVVSSLDVSVRNEILLLLHEVRHVYNLTSVFISHDMSSVAQLATHIGVMYRGRLVEYGKASDVIHHPRHSYTASLLDAVPRLEGRRNVTEQSRR